MLSTVNSDLVDMTRKTELTTNVNKSNNPELIQLSLYLILTRELDRGNRRYQSRFHNQN